MSSINYPQPGPQISLVEVVKTAALELQRLRAHHRAVSKRIRHLRIAVGALRELKGPHRRLSEASDLKSSNTPTSLQEWTTLRLQSHDLRRACRIALLETVDAVSCQEIYSRIVRRGSFFFPSAAVAACAIVQELTAMADAGEVHCVNAAGEPQWQRISLSHD